MRNGSVRRFAAVWTLSVLWKIAALAAILYVVVRLSGGGGL